MGDLSHQIAQSRGPEYPGGWDILEHRITWAARIILAGGIGMLGLVILEGWVILAHRGGWRYGLFWRVGIF